MKCPNCGEMIKEKKKMNFCGFCGSNLKTGEKTLTLPESDDNFSSGHNIPAAASDSIIPEASPAPAQNLRASLASPFEQMVKESAAAQGAGGFQTTITPPPFENASVSEVPSFSAVQAPAAEKSSSPLNSFDPSSLSAFDPYKAQQAAAAANDDIFKPTITATVNKSVSEKEEEPAGEVKNTASSPIGAFDPSSLSAFDPYKAQQAAAAANDDIFKPAITAAVNKSVPEKEAEPADEVKNVTPASPIGSFDPSSLSAFDPYKAQQAAAKANDDIFKPTEPAAEKKDEHVSFRDALEALVEETSEPIDPVIPEEKSDEPAVTPEAEEKKHSGYQGINISKNVKIRNVSDDPNSSSGTYMEYTREAETENADSSFSKYSSFSFTSSEKPAEEQSDTEEVKKKNEEARKEEAKKHLDESVDSILNFASGRSSVNLKKETAVSTDESADTEASEKNFISLTKSSDTPKETEPSAPLTKEEPEEVKAPEPQPEPEPVKEKVINYVGQEKKAAEQMIAFKGLVSEIEYVDDEKDFNFVIGQSIPADTEVLPGTTIKLTVSAGTWSEWEENPVPVSSNNFITETKTEYRKRSRTRSIDKRDTTDTSEFEDYTLTGQDSKYSDWEVDQYYSSEAVPPGPTCEIVRVTNGFKYAGWFNPANPGGMSFSSPDVANFFNTNLSNVKWSYEEIISEQNIKPDVKNWKLVTDNMNSTPAGDPMISNIFFSAHVVDGKSYAMKYGSAETEWYIYKKRALLETVYHFEKEIISDWSEWTEWAEKELTGSEDCQVEKRVLTRSRRKIPNA